jgi:hypothetical protein
MPSSGSWVLAGRWRWWSGRMPASVRRSRRRRQPTAGPGAWPRPGRGPAPGRWAPSWLAGPRWVGGRLASRRRRGRRAGTAGRPRPSRAAVEDRVQQGVGAEDGELVGGELVGVVVLGHGCLLCLVPAGQAWVLARPGRPVAPGRLGAGAVKGPPQAERALMGAQRPLTAQAARWQPDWQANGRAVWGRGAVGVPARQRPRRVEVVGRPART